MILGTGPVKQLRASEGEQIPQECYLRRRGEYFESLVAWIFLVSQVK